MGLRRLGLSLYIANIFSVLTGAIFVLAITRSLTVGEFGEWYVASAILSYINVVYQFFPFCVTRFRARGVVRAR